MSNGSTIEWLAWPGYRPASWNPMLCTERGIRPVIDGINIQTPMRWRKPRCALVDCDLFSLPDDAIDRVFAVAALCQQHRFIILTKRAERMRDYTGTRAVNHVIALRDALGKLPLPRNVAMIHRWPLPNVILGVSVEDQATADERIPHLLATPAACRMVSAEPLLGAVKLREVLGDDWLASGKSGERRGLDWIVTGGESGPGARPMHPDWARSIRDQCQEAGVPFFFKQWGEWLPWSQFGQSSVADRIDATAFRTSEWDGEKWGDVGYPQWCDIVDGSIDDEQCVGKVGKRRAGRLLDGRTHDEFPDISPKIPA